MRIMRDNDLDNICEKCWPNYWFDILDMAVYDDNDNGIASSSNAVRTWICTDIND